MTVGALQLVSGHMLNMCGHFEHACNTGSCMAAALGQGPGAIMYTLLCQCCEWGCWAAHTPQMGQVLSLEVKPMVLAWFYKVTWQVPDAEMQSLARRAHETPTMFYLGTKHRLELVF